MLLIIYNGTKLTDSFEIRQFLHILKDYNNTFFQVFSLGKKMFHLNYLHMLDYVKTILSKVSFNKELFEKELRKALKMLIPEEMIQLKSWCYENYSQQHPIVLQKVFN